MGEAAPGRPRLNWGRPDARIPTPETNLQELLWRSRTIHPAPIPTMHTFSSLLPTLPPLLVPHTRASRPLLAVLLSLLVSAVAAEAEMRTFTDVEGRTVVAELVSAN